MNKDCFTCAKSTGCLLTWMCYDNPESFDTNEVYGCSYEPMKKVITYDCNKPDEIWKQIKNLESHEGNVFLRGSRTYVTATVDSDFDWGLIVDDDSIIIDVPGVFDNEKCDTRIHPCVGEKNDFEIVRKSDFIDMIKEHEPFAIEPLILTSNISLLYDKYLKIDPWKLRCKFGKISNNSWSKAKKKMTVEEGEDNFYLGVKSLFHSLRLMLHACFFTKGYITSEEEQQIKDLHSEIMNDYKSGFKWEDFKNKYKPMYNQIHSEMVKLCPKPEEEFKNNKK